MKGTARGRGRGRATPVVPASRAIGATFPSPGRRRCHRAHLDDIQGLDDAGGAHAGQAAVHERLDGFPGGVIFQRHDDAVVWCVRRRTARRSRGGCFFVRDREISPEPAAAAISPSRLCATSFAWGFFASLWRVEENHGLLTLGESKNETPPSRVFLSTPRDRDARDFAQPSRKKITRVALFV